MNVERAIAVVALAAGMALGGVVAAGSAEGTAAKGKAAAATPGAEHKVLENFVGHWTSRVTMQMDPSQPPQESDGTADGQMVLGGRYVHVIHKGTFMDQPFEGMMLSGYDIIAKTYVSAWVDNMGTAIGRYEGGYDAATKKLTMVAHYTDPMTWKPAKTRAVTTFVDPDHWTYEEYVPGPDGKEMLTLTIAFKRG